MPQSTDEQRAEWDIPPDNAIDHLEKEGYVQCQNFSWSIPYGKKPSDKDISALCFLADEWDWGGIEYVDIIVISNIDIGTGPSAKKYFGTPEIDLPNFDTGRAVKAINFLRGFYNGFPIEDFPTRDVVENASPGIVNAHRLANCGIIVKMLVRIDRNGKCELISSELQQPELEQPILP